jgi:hypothetical protein
MFTILKKYFNISENNIINVELAPSIVVLKGVD